MSDASSRSSVLRAAIRAAYLEDESRRRSRA